MESASYPLSLTVEYERNKDDDGNGWTETHGFAVIRLGAVVVHREPMNHGSPFEVGRDDLEQAAAAWLVRIGGNDHAS